MARRRNGKQREVAGGAKDKVEVVEKAKEMAVVAREKEEAKAEKEDNQKEQAEQGGWMAVNNDGAARARTGAMAQAGRKKPHTRAGSRERQSAGGRSSRWRCRQEQRKARKCQQVEVEAKERW